MQVKKRFITQLEVEKQAKHTITHKFIMLYYRKQPINQWLLKSESVMLRLKEI
jgi:hypothetical protein